MFNKESSSISIFDQSTEIKCETLICNNIDLLGKFFGTLNAKNVFIKNKGYFNGKIFCKETLKIENSILEGEVFASYVYLFKGAVLKGKIRYVNLHIEEGAILESDDIKKITEDEILDFFQKNDDKI